MHKLVRIFKRILFNPMLIFNYLAWEVRSLLFSRHINEGRGKLIIRSSGINLIIKKGKKAKFNLYGNLIIAPFFKDSSPIVISIAENAVLNIYGDFMIGEGVNINISNNASLSFGGKDKESASGITGKTLIMVNKKIEIGKDFLCAWDVFITDSDWHKIEGKPHQKDVFIGDHVWIANNSNVLKGSVIGDNCILSSCSKVGNSTFGNDLLLGGIPAKILKENISWTRDIE